MPKTRGQIVREVAMEWMREGKLHAPPDDVSGDDDQEFWDEVGRRCEAANLNGPTGQ